MRIAAIYDIHGNLPALEAVLEDIRRAEIDKIVVGGDVLPGPMPRETIARLLDLDVPVHFIHGNGDREVLAQMEDKETDWFRTAREQWREPVRWSAQQLHSEDKQLRVQFDGLGEVLFCHATPRNDTEIFTRLTPEDCLLPVFDELGAQIVVCGHTHMQFDRVVRGVRVLNAGSVGMPFGEPSAYWLLLGPDIQFRRTSYDLENAAVRIRTTKYPQAEAFAARSVLHPPSEEEMLEAFGRVVLK